MAVRCTFCANLSIPHLVHLAAQEFESKVFPSTYYYQHHGSFEDLELSAMAGCDLCLLIIDSFKVTPWDEMMWVATREGRKSTSVVSSMYARAKGLPTSEVKISIDCSETWACQTLEDVRILDTLTVLIGPNYDKRDPDDEDEDEKWALEKWVPILPLTLTVPRGQETIIEGVRIGRWQVEATLGSPANFTLARGWLDTCRSAHSSCLSKTPCRLPTRVLDVGIGVDSATAKILLTEGKIEAEYTALSHCWGGDIETKLTSKTINDWQVALPWQILPANFKDAITITRELGIQYLWVDSLCILQDSPSDWEAEAAKMGQVYGDASLTIFAVAAKGNKAGILFPSTDATARRESSPVFLPVDPDQGTQVRVEHRDLHTDEEDLYKMHLHGPLNKRGWCLQESVLSPRGLFYGACQIYWKCPDGYASADGLCRHARGPPSLYRDISSQFYAERLISTSDGGRNSVARRDLLEDYYTLVNYYTGRQLTFGSNKLPAFSGLARRLSPALGEYAAGIWLSDWRRGLLWSTELGFCPHERTPYRAPSWSWAVTDGLVMFDESFNDQSRWTSYPAFESKLLESRIAPCNAADPFGRIDKAYLVIEGLTAPLVRSRQVANLRSSGMVSFDELDSTSWGVLGRNQRRVEDAGQEEAVLGLCALVLMNMATWGGNEEETVGRDRSNTMLAIRSSIRLDAVRCRDLEVDCDAFEEEEYMLLLIHANDVPVRENEERTPNARCLVIKSIDKGTGGAYERVGVAFLDPRAMKVEDWEKRVITLF